MGRVDILVQRGVIPKAYRDVAVRELDMWYSRHVGHLMERFALSSVRGAVAGIAVHEAKQTLGIGITTSREIM